MPSAQSLKRASDPPGCVISRSQRNIAALCRRRSDASGPARGCAGARHSTRFSRSSRSSSASAWYIGERSKWPPSLSNCSGNSRARMSSPQASQCSASAPSKYSPANTSALALANRWLPSRCHSSRCVSQRACSARLSSQAGSGVLPPRNHLTQLTMRRLVGNGAQAVPRPGGFSASQRTISARCASWRCAAPAALRSSK